MNESTPAVDDDDITIDGTDLLTEIKALQAVPDPDCAGPNSADPNSAGPNSADPNSAGPNSADPNSAGPNSADPNSADPADLTIDGADLLAELRAEVAPMSVPPPPKQIPPTLISETGPHPPPPAASSTPPPTAASAPSPSIEAATLTHWQPSNHWQPSPAAHHRIESTKPRAGIDSRLQVGAIVIAVVLGLAGAAFVWQSRAESDTTPEQSAPPFDERLTTGSWQQ